MERDETRRKRTFQHLECRCLSLNSERNVNELLRNQFTLSRPVCSHLVIHNWIANLFVAQPGAQHVTANEPELPIFNSSQLSFCRLFAFLPPRWCTAMCAIGRASRHTGLLSMPQSLEASIIQIYWSLIKCVTRARGDQCQQYHRPDRVRLRFVLFFSSTPVAWKGRGKCQSAAVDNFEWWVTLDAPTPCNSHTHTHTCFV